MQFARQIYGSGTRAQNMSNGGGTIANRQPTNTAQNLLKPKIMLPVRTDRKDVTPKATRPAKLS